MTFYTRDENELFGRQPGYAYAGDRVHTATGNFVRGETDLAMADPLLSWRRTYNARKAEDSGLGPGWTHSHGARLEFPAPDRVLLHGTCGRVLTFRRRADAAAEDAQAEHRTGEFERPQDLAADLYALRDGERYELRFFSGEVWAFDASGVWREMRAAGRRVALRYEGGRLVRVEGSTGRALGLEYDGDGRLGAVRSDDGRSVAYGYDGDALGRVARPGGVTVGYDSDSVARIVRVTDADGVVEVSNEYDEDGRVARQEPAGAGVLRFDYDLEHGRTSVTHEPSGAETGYAHDEDGRPVRVTDALGHSSTMEYGPDGLLTGAELPGGTVLERVYDDGNLVSASDSGATVRYVHDDRRRLVQLTAPTGESTTYAYEGEDRVPSRITGPDGAVTRLVVRDGLVVARTGPDGATERFRYDERRDLVETVDAGGQRTRHAYDAAGRRTATTRPTDETTTVAYDEAGRPVALTDAGGVTVTRTYSATGRLLEYTDGEGATTAFGYDASGRLERRTDRKGLVTRYEYDGSGQPAALIRPDGTRTETRFDAAGRLKRVEEPDAGVTTYAYDPAGNPTAVHAPDGTTTMSFDARGNQTSVTFPGGATHTFAYDAADRLTERVDAAGAHWTTDFDPVARTITDTGPDGARRTRILDAEGRTTASVDPLGRRTEHRYDGNGRVREIVDPEGGRTRFARDGLGRVVARTTPAGLTTRYTYRDGRLATVTDPRGWITRFRYDRAGRRTRVVSPSGATTSYAYDKRGALTKVTDPRGGVTAYGYDKGGRLTKVTDAKGVSTTYGHDRAGRRTTITDPLGRTTRRAYDDQGRVESVRDAAGGVVHFAYDDAGRLIRRWTEDGEEVTYAYDGAGRRTAMTDSTGTTRYAYDANGRLTSVTWPGDDTYTWEYDAAGQLRKLTYPDDAYVSYRHDLNGRLISLNDSAAGEAVYAVDPDGRLLTEQLPGGWARRYGYDGGLLSEFTELRTNVVATHVTLERDSEGRIARHTEGSAVRDYTYDPAGQLVAAHLDRAGTTLATDIGYDLAGNRTMTVTGGAATRYLYDAADQLVAIESKGRRIRYSYDGAGRLTEADDGEIRQRIAYDGFHHPRRTVTSRAWAVERAEMTYNGDGYLVGRKGRTGDDSAPHTDVRYRWTVGDALPQILDQRVATEVPQSSNRAPLGRDLATARFTYGYGRTFATTCHGPVTFARDAFGSAVATRATEPWVEAGAYDSFGAAPGTPILPEPHLSARIPRFGHRGELADGPVLNLRARHYDTTLGRFTTRDPVSVLGKSSLANHPYAYAHSDPLNRVDPRGTWPTVFGGVATLVADVLRSPLPAFGCDGCRDPGNGIESHRKCFQNRTCLATRGSFSADALDADPGTLKDLWHSGRRERMGHALTLYELNGRRQGFWDEFWEDLGSSRAISQNVDWEVGTRTAADPPPHFRIDILTEEEQMFEVKLWKNGAAYWEVEQQLDQYLLYGSFRDLLLFKSKELQDWADSVDVITGLRWPWSEEIVYVWGLGNSEGHIYVAHEDDDRLNDDMKNKAEENREQREWEKESMPFPLPVPVPVPVPV